MQAPDSVEDGAGLTISHLFKSNNFLLPLVVAILTYRYISSQIICRKMPNILYQAISTIGTK
jgi:hypothetical protein